MRKIYHGVMAYWGVVVQSGTTCGRREIWVQIPALCLTKIMVLDNWTNFSACQVPVFHSEDHCGRNKDYRCPSTLWKEQRRSSMERST